MKNLSKAALAAVIAVSGALAPVAAFAHADVVATTPSADSTVDAGTIADIDIEFGEDLLQSPDGSGNEIQVVSDVDGTVQTVGCVTVTGAHLTAKFAPVTDGPATVTWRAVADDGHPLTESFKINISNPNSVDAADLSDLCVMPIAYNTMAGGEAKDAVAKNDGSGSLLGLGVGIVFIVIFSVIGGIQAKRRMDKEAKENK